MLLEKSYLITGTDTGVGKTYITSLLLKNLKAREVSATGLKPICCGGLEDVKEIHQAFPHFSQEEIFCYSFQASLSPYGASLLENQQIDLEILSNHYKKIAQKCSVVLVEGIGGWEVPLCKNFCFSDYAYSLHLPVLLVVANRLGALNHTLLTLNAIRAKGLECAGIILNSLEEERGIAQTNNKAILEQVIDIPILADVLYGEDELDLFIS